VSLVPNRVSEHSSSLMAGSPGSPILAASLDYEQDVNQFPVAVAVAPHLFSSTFGNYASVAVRAEGKLGLELTRPQVQIYERVAAPTPGLLRAVG
jgi:hypothetical protein